MEEILVPEQQRSNLIDKLDQVMVLNPMHWQKYYQGDPAQQQFARLYSLSDRCRYYWSNPILQDALQRLLENQQHHTLPLSLISQFMPNQYEHIRQGKISNSAEELIKDKIVEVLEIYRMATSRS
jgi:D-tagatose-1,6-bisphosphate aldolase subunit GatZ/KbaZ